MGVKEDFYYKLQKDYEYEQLHSVLALHIEEERKEQFQEFLESKKGNSSYSIQIRCCLKELCEAREVLPEHLGKLLAILKSSPIPYPGDESESSWKLLAEAAAAGLGETDTLYVPCAEEESRAKRNAGIKNRLKELPEASPELYRRFVAVPSLLKRERLRALAEDMRESVIHKAVRDYFNNAGFPLPSRKKSGKKAEQPGEKKAKADVSLKLLDLYCGRYGYSLFQSAGASAEDCGKLLECLNGRGKEKKRNREKYRKALVPLRVDSRTGCALYIVGRDYFDGFYRTHPYKTDRKAFYDSADACAYGIFCMDFLKIDDFLSVGNMLVDGFFAYSSFEEAMAGYEISCSCVFDELSQERNFEAPDACPEAFRCYFMPVAEIRDPEKEELEERRAFEEEQQREKSPAKKCAVTSKGMVGRSRG